jgi:hypothetical protein
VSPQPRKGDGARRLPSSRKPAPSRADTLKRLAGGAAAAGTGGGAGRKLAPLAALAAAAAGALVARRRAGGGDAPPFDATPTAPEPAVRAAAAQATPVGPPPSAEPATGTAAEAELSGRTATDGPATSSPDAAAPPAPEPVGDPQTVGLYVLHQGPRSDRARTSLAEALGSAATLGVPDDVGRFDVVVPAASPQAAEQFVRSAFAASGTGDDFTIVTGTQGREIPSDDPRQPDQ